MNDTTLSVAERELKDAAFRYAQCVERSGHGGADQWLLINRSDMVALRALRVACHRSHPQHTSDHKYPHGMRKVTMPARLVRKLIGIDPKHITDHPAKLTTDEERHLSAWLRAPKPKPPEVVESDPPPVAQQPTPCDVEGHQLALMTDSPGGQHYACRRCYYVEFP